MEHRMSMISTGSNGQSVHQPAGAQHVVTASANSLLNAIRRAYMESKPYNLDSTTSITLNTWLNVSQGYLILDNKLAAQVWEHAKRRAENQCIILGSLHEATPPILGSFLQTLPVPLPSSIQTSLDVIKPFLSCVTSQNPSTSRASALGVTLTLDLTGNILGASLALPKSGVDVVKGLLNVPAEIGNRAFDVFYYLLASSSTVAERQFLGLKSPSEYALLARSGTFDPPPCLVGDAAAADDFRQALKEIGIKGSVHRQLISTLVGLLKLGNTLDYSSDADELEEICADAGELMGIDPEFLLRQSTEDRVTLCGALYEAVVDWIISMANEAIDAELCEMRNGVELSSMVDTDTVIVTVIDVPDTKLGQALAMGTTFDDTVGINAEIAKDGVEIPPISSTVLSEVKQIVSEKALDLGVTDGIELREHESAIERRAIILNKTADASEDGLLTELLAIKAEKMDLLAIVDSNRVWHHLSLHPTDSPLTTPTLPLPWSSGSASQQIRLWRLVEWANRRNKTLNYTVDFFIDEFSQRYASIGCQDGKDGIESWMLARGWSNGQILIGEDRVWVQESTWMEAEGLLDLGATRYYQGSSAEKMRQASDIGYTANGSGMLTPQGFNESHFGSNDNLLRAQTNRPETSLSQNPTIRNQASAAGDYGLGTKGDNYRGYGQYDPYQKDMEEKDESGNADKPKKMSSTRRTWVNFVWVVTFWIPDPLLKYIGRMRRPDVRQAWREKFTLCLLILLINAWIVFWIVGFGKVLCPNQNKAWNKKQLSTHQGKSDFYVGIHGKVYDITKFWRRQHSDTDIETTEANMMPLAGMILDDYFVAPLNKACPGLGIKETTRLTANNTVEYSTAVHTSGYYATDRTSALGNADWYWNNFEPTIKEYYKGDLVWKSGKVKSEGSNDNHMWARYGNRIYDLTNYFYTQKRQPNVAQYEFLSSDLTDLWKNKAGQNIKTDIDDLILNSTGNKTKNAEILNSWSCIQKTTYVGITDFRDSARCQVNNWILLAYTIIICVVVGVKFICALQLGSKKRPLPQNKFVICQVPAYTEGEDSLRKAIDSLTALDYDNKRKLICVICDGIVVGQGNDRPTPKIVLDILGVDPKLDPPALPFKSVGTGSDQLNYGKVYSGLYEYEGNVVPYLVIVKVGKESEQTMAKPGNRGKRDTQILLMSFLNRVHHNAPMNALELEMFHQINNIIGVDPELYEYVLMVDADTCVKEDSLTRLVAACANNGKIAGICGETALNNDDKSWTTMIQVYEYFISHHLAKSFESLFGSVTCLPGCFTMYRIRTADKGKPLIISDTVIKDYSICDLDTLHKKNLLALGEDRYLTTLMLKHHPNMAYKFVPSAKCETAAPEAWSVLLSQRRRWINSTIHNLFELVTVKGLCGFGIFSMRFVVFLDLFGTIIFPATCAYLFYIIIMAATGKGQFPLISIIMLAAIYGLQVVLFIIKRQWQHIGWMIIYLLALPIYSFVLPVYSFWNQDNFSWGNTRVAIGEKGQKQVVSVDSEPFDPRSIPLQRWDDYAIANGLPGHRSAMQEMRDYSMGTPSVIGSQYNAPQSHYAYSMRDGGRNTPADFYRSASVQPGTDHLRDRHSFMTMGNTPSPQPMPSSISLRHSPIERNDSVITEAVRSVLAQFSLDQVTKKQVLVLVHHRLGMEMTSESRALIGKEIDNELERM